VVHITRKKLLQLNNFFIEDEYYPDTFLYNKAVRLCLAALLFCLRIYSSEAWYKFLCKKMDKFNKEIMKKYNTKERKIY